MLDAPTFFEPWDVAHRLAELDLKEEMLLKAAHAGLAALTSCTENHPPGAPGYFCWAETVRALRDLHAPKWSRKNENNLPLVLNEGETVAIVVATGDADTGRPTGHPRTKAAKGPRTKGKVQANQYMEYLFPEMAAEAAADVGAATWVFLVHCDMKAQEFRCELSRPIEMNDEGYINRWAERIILKSTPIDGGLADIVPYDNDGGTPQTPELKIEIKARA